MSAAVGVLVTFAVSLAAGLIASSISRFVPWASAPPAPFLRVENGSVTLRKRTLSSPIVYDPAVEEVVIEGQRIELGGESPTGIRVGAFLVTAPVVFVILLWLLVLV